VPAAAGPGHRGDLGEALEEIEDPMLGKSRGFLALRRFLDVSLTDLRSISELLKPGRLVTLQGASSKEYYCSGLTLECKSRGVGHWERFLVVDAGEGYIALKGGEHRCRGVDGKPVACTKGP